MKKIMRAIERQKCLSDIERELKDANTKIFGWFLRKDILDLYGLTTEEMRSLLLVKFVDLLGNFRDDRVFLDRDYLIISNELNDISHEWAREGN